MIPPTRITKEMVDAANNAWGFNCGPGALCAVTGLTPDDVRPHLGQFETRGYTTPKMMGEFLSSLGLRFSTTYRNKSPRIPLPRLKNGVVRVQWGGPWMKPGVPHVAQYCQTHWLAVHGDLAWDVNTAHLGQDGWYNVWNWENGIAQLIVKHAVKRGDGTWFPTHGIEVEYPEGLR